MYQDLKNILVAENEEKDSQICVTMSTIPTNQGGAPEVDGTTTISTNTGMEMGAHHYGFHR